MNEKKLVPIFEAKNKLPYYIYQAENDGPVFLSRRNKEVCVILSTKSYENLLKKAESNRKSMSFLERVKEFHERNNQDWFTDEEIAGIFNKSRISAAEMPRFNGTQNCWDGVLEGLEENNSKTENGLKIQER